MCQVKDIKTSTEWYNLWKQVEQQIEDEYALYAGVSSAENDNDKLEFDNRIGKLESLAERYHRKYTKACKVESKGSISQRLKTYNNGL